MDQCSWAWGKFVCFPRRKDNRRDKTSNFDRAIGYGVFDEDKKNDYLVEGRERGDHYY